MPHAYSESSFPNPPHPVQWFPGLIGQTASNRVKPKRTLESKLAGIRARSAMGHPLRRFRFDGGGEVDVEGGAFAGFGMDVHAAARLLEQAMDNGQAQARAFPRRLGREIRLKNLGQNIRRECPDRRRARRVAAAAACWRSLGRRECGRSARRADRKSPRPSPGACRKYRPECGSGEHCSALMARLRRIWIRSVPLICSSTSWARAWILSVLFPLLGWTFSNSRKSSKI